MNAAAKIEDYALIGDTHTAALISRQGSLDWLCLPRFDSPACFAALLGTPEHGRWLIASEENNTTIRRRYRGDTLVLETHFITPTGTAMLLDFMPPRDRDINVVRIVVGVKGTVRMKMDMTLRFDYGSIVPWVSHRRRFLKAVAGPDAVYLETEIELKGVGFSTVADFTVTEGQEIPFTLTWRASHDTPPRPLITERALSETELWWKKWSQRCTYQGSWRDEVIRSLITLKALTYAPTGGIVAAPTTSLPELLGGVRNWDYRYCWIRDATFTLYALMKAGYHSEAKAWREWLLRAVAGKPSDLQIMYGIGGERRLTELELNWLPGYEQSIPVRIGNAASQQFQLDVYGEMMDTLHQARELGLAANEDSWRVQHAIMEFLESAWDRPDEGIWEVRGPRRHFTHSKVMAWVAVDRAVKAIERCHVDGPLERWRALRTAIHEQVCREGYDSNRETFVQYYGGTSLDGSLLMIPLVGFLPPFDPRVQGTLHAIERELTVDGLVRRYQPSGHVDGLPGDEGMFLPCSFWLVDNLLLSGRVEEARRLYDRLIGLSNDVGLLSEEYDLKNQRLVGNFPQAFSHVSLIDSAYGFSRMESPAEHRQRS
ncbi:MAG: Glycoside hydrolase family 15 protein [Nitrospira sp.]|nr:glycoside hydrolase family 15 protein [Nitrospira sp.]ULA58654.1 MAG: Glycoside hydrolase family 15 protein [Nitrospira sp.]